MYKKISYTFQRIPDTQSRVITKVYDFLGQPSYFIYNTKYLITQGPSVTIQGLSLSALQLQYKVYHSVPFSYNTRFITKDTSVTIQGLSLRTLQSQYKVFDHED